MTARWDDLAEPWRLAFEQAVTAYLAHASIPIGAVVLDAAGQVIARGANDFASSRLAHAELATLNALPAETERGRCEIYSTLEPCPMCTGAIRIAQLRAVHFAARDPGAGSAALLRASAFMRAFPCEVHPPHDAALEGVVVSLMIEYRNRTGHMRWLDNWRAYHPTGVARGQALFASGTHGRWLAQSASAQSIFEHVAAMTP